MFTGIRGGWRSLFAPLAAYFKKEKRPVLSHVLMAIGVSRTGLSPLGTELVVQEKQLSCNPLDTYLYLVLVV